MKRYSEHLKRLTKEINTVLLERSNEAEIDVIQENISDSKMAISTYIEEYFDNDIKIKYTVEISGKSTDILLIDVQPKNLYTSCKFLGYPIEEDCPEEGKVEFERLTILYAHINGMTIIPEDSSDDLNDINPIF